MRPADASVLERCRAEAVQEAIAHLDGADAVSATVNTTGQYQPPRLAWAPPPGMSLPEPPLYTGLPDYCDVRVRKLSPGGHVAEIMVWVPLRWNRRFLGTGGAGNRTDPPWFFLPHDRVLMMPAAVRNGFATASTDGGSRDHRHVDWALADGAGDLDWELIRNRAHRSTHEMTVIGKAVTGAVHGTAPEYSYFQGCSGGGRQALMQAQRYPADDDGVWSANPAINWTKMVPAELEAFRAAAVAACDGADGLRDGVIGAFDSHEFDPAQLVGEPTAGEPLWFGLRPGAESWGDNVYQHGRCLTARVGGELVPVPFGIAESWFRWVAGDPGLGLRAMMGAISETASFARLFVTEGDVHSSRTGRGPGLSLAAGMAALMNWVENGIAPDPITAERFDLRTGTVTATRPVYAYSAVPRYRGSGDPDDASSFIPQQP